MTFLKFIPCLALLTAALHAQAPAEPGPLTPDQQPETQAMATAARNLTRTSKASDEAKADAAKLIEVSATVQGGETRRKLANAITLLSGGAWDAKVELAWSLGMKLDTAVADSGTPVVARIVALYPASFKAAHALQVKAMLVPPGSKKSDPPAMKGVRAYPVGAGSFTGEFGFDANPGRCRGWSVYLESGDHGRRPNDRVAGTADPSSSRDFDGKAGARTAPSENSGPREHEEHHTIRPRIRRCELWADRFRRRRRQSRLRRGPRW